MFVIFLIYASAAQLWRCETSVCFVSMRLGVSLLWGIRPNSHLICAWKYYLIIPYFRQILCFQNPAAANGHCLWLSAEKVANCRNLCFDGFKHLSLCFQFAAIWVNGFFTEQSCKQAYIIIAILHINILPFVWNCCSSGDFFFFTVCMAG